MSKESTEPKRVYDAKGNKTLDKVAKARLENPGASLNDIAKIAGVGKASVHRADKKLNRIGTKYPEIEKFIEGGLVLMGLGQEQMISRIQDDQTKKEIHIRDLNAITDSAAKRYSLFKGNVTDEAGGLNKTEEMSTEELLNFVTDTDD